MQLIIAGMHKLWVCLYGLRLSAPVGGSCAPQQGLAAAVPPVFELSSSVAGPWNNVLKRHVAAMHPHVCPVFDPTGVER